MHGLFSASVRVKPEVSSKLVHHVVDAERSMVEALRRPAAEEAELRVRHVVVPLLAAVVSAPS